MKKIAAICLMLTSFCTGDLRARDFQGKDLKTWLKHLDDQDPAAQQVAFTAVAAYASKGTPEETERAIAGLLGIFVNQEMAPFRNSAVEALGKSGWEKLTPEQFNALAKGTLAVLRRESTQSGTEVAKAAAVRSLGEMAVRIGRRRDTQENLVSEILKVLFELLRDMSIKFLNTEFSVREPRAEAAQQSLARAALKDLPENGRLVYCDITKKDPARTVVFEIDLTGSQLSLLEMTQLIKNVNEKMNGGNLHFQTLKNILAEDGTYDVVLALKLSGTRVRPYDLATLPLTGDFQKLRIDLSKTTLQKVPSFPKSELVAELDLSETKINDCGLEGIARLEKLEVLKIAKTKITDHGLANLVVLKNTLTTLDVSDTKVTDSGLALLAEFPWADLNLSNTKVSDAGLLLLNTGALETLSLGNTNIGDPTLANLGTAPKLKKLVASKTNVSDGGVASLPRTLTDLDVSGTYIGDEALVGLAHLSNLKSLNVSKTLFRGSTVSGLEQLTSLKVLDLSDTFIRDDGIGRLQAIAPWLLNGTTTPGTTPVVGKLILHKNRISRNAIDDLRDAFRGRNVNVYAVRD
jgi:hypothetical protein